MLLSEFPNINWLKRQIIHQFQAGKGPNGQTLPFRGWPNVLLNTSTKHCERVDIQGPFSIFMNRQGSSLVGVGQQKIKIKENAYVVTNSNDHYNLLIDEQHPTETFNIHFGTEFLEEAWHAHQHSTHYLLDEPVAQPKQEIPFALKATWRNPSFNQLVTQLEFAYKYHKEDKALQEEILLNIFTAVLQQNQVEQKSLTQLPALKKSTQAELIKRLHRAVDYIYAYYNNVITVDELAQIACLSKFHFLRSFKAAFGMAPYQFIKHLRSQEAIQLLQNSKASVQEVAFQVGIENASSLSRMLFKQTGSYPSAFRKLKN